MLHAVITGAAVYFALVAILRVSGKRTLSKWNAFDSIVTFALGSIVATATLSPTTSVAEGILAVALFVVLQFVMTWLSVRSAAIRRIIKPEPVFLMFEGAVLDDALRHERVTQGELLAALRGSGLVSIEQAHTVVLETSGTFSVMPNPGLADRSALVDVRHTDKSEGRLRSRRARPGLDGDRDTTRADSR